MASTWILLDIDRSMRRSFLIGAAVITRHQAAGRSQVQTGLGGITTKDWAEYELRVQCAIIPKYRKKVLYGRLRGAIGRILRELCDQRGVELVEGHAMADHVHMCLSIPPKFSVSHTIGFLKGKSAVRVHRELLRERRMTGLHFWATGYCVSTVGLDEDRIRKYIREQEKLAVAEGDLDLR